MSERVAHTPGPWHFLVDPKGKYGIAPVGGKFLAITDTEANARLIAAAPDILTALRALVSDVLEYERINNLAPTPGKQDCWQSITNARAAIAKAEGGAP